jgi:excisionase family DNA binding protein
VDEETYTPSEAARVLGISKRQVTNLLNAGELEGAQEASGRWRVPKRAVHALLEERRKGGRPPSRSSTQRTPGARNASERSTEDRERVEDLLRRMGRLEGRLELEETARSTVEDQLGRERDRADAAERRAEQLEQELRESRRGFWSRLFGN